MSSRVQKGGLIFKPVAKARARATSSAPRQASNPAPNPAQSTGSATAAIASTSDAVSASHPMHPSSMPPPALIPVRGSDHPDVSRIPDSQAMTPPFKAPPVLIPSVSRIVAPPAIATSSQISLNTLRNSPAPPAIISRETTAPVPTIPHPSAYAPTPSPTLVNPTVDAPLLYNSQIAPPEVDFPEQLSQLVEPSNPSTLVASTQDTSEHTPEATPKKKLRKRKKLDTSEAIAAEVETSEKPKKSRKKRTKKAAGDVSDGGQPTDASDGNATEGEVPEKPKKAKRKRVKKDAGEISDGGQPKSKPKKKRKPAKIAEDGGDTANEADELSTPPKKRRRKSTVPVFDPDADPGEEIDPTVVTMSELCVDNGLGRISSKAVEIQKNHMAWKQQSKDKRARMKALAEQKKYGKADEEDGNEGNTEDAAAGAQPPAPADSAETIVGPSEPSESDPVIADASGSGFDYSKDLTSSRFTVQVRIGPNGETIIDEESLTVDRTEEVDTTNYVHVVESDATKFVNSASYAKKCRGSRWSTEETELFFEALSQHGENYELISLVLPGRSRTACKNKFKAEDKKDSARITRCLESRTPIDMKTLSRLTGRDFSGPVPVIRVPTPPPPPDPATQEEREVDTRAVVRKRSRSRALASTEGVQIIGDADSYDAYVELS
ncbi:hypothetical protein B0H15DRAFT_874772 [Mycena belliarum]|uniref:Myb-like domain-containing protein n=1 Tax=Mycena belliarum TaxID=1033014 RepID=A0AAD6ULR6_9AGAR|nr:hypothetical protein B0H15DRAFT_874772 [Mycena belliae]